MSDELNRLLGRSEQADKAYCDMVLHSYATMFRALCAEDGITRAEAMEIVRTIISSRESVNAAFWIRKTAGEGST